MMGKAVRSTIKAPELTIALEYCSGEQDGEGQAGGNKRPESPLGQRPVPNLPTRGWPTSPYLVGRERWEGVVQQEVAALSAPSEMEIHFTGRITTK